MLLLGLSVIDYRYCCILIGLACAKYAKRLGYFAIKECFCPSFVALLWRLISYNKLVILKILYIEGDL